MPDSRRVVGGIDTHKEMHVAGVVDEVGGVLATESFPATPKGYGQLISWMRSFGQVLRVGIEGTGSYGAGISERFAAAEIEVVEINRPNRQMRRLRGKSDEVDAVAAARAALVDENLATPKGRSGIVESIRALRVAFTSMRNTRTRVANQIHGLVVTAPELLRIQLQDLELDDCVSRCARLRPGNLADPINGTRSALKALSRQYLELTDQLEELQSDLTTLVAQANLALVSAYGVGADVASILLIVAGENPERLKSEAAFAALCGVSPVDASSGKTIRRRLNQGGNRQGNHALWRIVMVRLSKHAETRAYAERRKAEGKTIKETIRCLKRYVAREIFQLLTNPQDVPAGPELRAKRTRAQVSLAVVADRFKTYPIFVSKIERGLSFDSGFAIRYEKWLDDQLSNV